MRIFALVLLSIVSFKSIGQVKNDSLILFISSRIDSLTTVFTTTLIDYEVVNNQKTGVIVLSNS